MKVVVLGVKVRLDATTWHGRALEIFIGLSFGLVLCIPGALAVAAALVSRGAFWVGDRLVDLDAWLVRRLCR